MKSDQLMEFCIFAHLATAYSTAVQALGVLYSVILIIFVELKKESRAFSGPDSTASYLQIDKI